MVLFRTFRDFAHLTNLYEAKNIEYHQKCEQCSIEHIQTFKQPNYLK